MGHRRGDFEQSVWLQSQEQRTLVVDYEEERIHKSAKFRFLVTFLIL